MGIVKIHSFQLVQGGLAGLKAEVDYQGVDKKGNSVVDLVKGYHRPLPIPDYLTSSLNSLKYYFLITTGHWDLDWDKFLRTDKSPIDAKETKNFDDYKKCITLLKNTEVTAVKYNGSYIILKGEIKTVGDKIIKVTSPNILEDDNDDLNGLFGEMVERCVSALGCVKTYLSSSKGDLMNPREYFKKVEKSEERLSALEGMTDKEVEEYMMQTLSDKGYLIMNENDIELIEDTDTLANLVNPVNIEASVEQYNSSAKEEELESELVAVSKEDDKW